MKVVFKRWRSCDVHGKRGARAYSWAWGWSPQWHPGARGKAPGQGIRAQSPLKLAAFHILTLKTRWKPPHHTTVLRPFFRDHPGEPVPEENFWILWCKERLTEADTRTIRLGATPSGLTSAHLHHPPIFYGPDALPAAQPTASKHGRQLCITKLLIANNSNAPNTSS